jgi:hypothetical protein
LILAIGTFFLPESPRYLISKQKNALALKTLSDLQGKEKDDPNVVDEFQSIQETLELESKLGQPTLKEMFTVYRKRSMIAIAVQLLGQLSGINIVTVSIYTKLVFYFLN